MTMAVRNSKEQLKGAYCDSVVYPKVDELLTREPPA